MNRYLFMDTSALMHAPNELKELKFEVIDMWHFFMNMMLGLRISSRELFTYYYYKNLENIRRYNSGY